MANFIDRIVGWVNPRAGLQRYFDRQRLTRAYEAASPRDTWRPRRLGASANADHMADATILRAKARALVQNVPYIRSAFDGLVSYTIGSGIKPRATGREADKINKLMEAWFDVCDADGRLDYFGIQAAAYRAMEQDGEVLIRLRPRFKSDGLPIPLQLQLLEIDWLDSTKTGSIDGNQIVNGIEYDVLGRVVAYWLWNQHPGDMVLLRGGLTQSTRVLAENIIHLFTPERPGQGRGFTRLAPVVSRVRDLQLYEDAELARKNLETRLGVLATGDLSQIANPAAMGEIADDVSRAKTTGDLGELSSGGITQLPPGVNLTVVEPKAAPGHVDYVKYQMHIISSGVGVPYEMMTGDMSEVNFSSARVRRLDFRNNVQHTQSLILIPKLLKRIHAAIVNAAYLNGSISSRDMSVDFSTPKWDYVNPEQDVKAELAEISGGLSSISEKLRQRGYNPDDVYKELASDIQKLKASGILDTLLFMQKGNLPTDQQSIQTSNAKQSGT